MNRNQARRLAAFNAKKAAEKRLENRIGGILGGCMSRVERATSLGRLRDKPTQEEIAERRNRIWYKQPGERGITCSGRQKMKLTSKPLI
ncbi:transcriptional regulator [Klebsiella oxytoca]|uniref:transcriptional regulator n=1 Tax=Klebsiella oxytoca TaxID=571 RepID=UPI0025996837|nr:transcriptional regulator [Klebsiella oxytoca]MDM4157339.1 transcriptional regulator [Klebsiella oxytoca]MDM4190624.1 transcriptional regulator [Klebsiella oxytoca]MDM4448282.1 transcriptional regulator [Klebsiella oxytoca]MDM7564372.1 transcriptional regulator [Klebsiella oxytoca]MDN4992633.1 transcriptional regulator [Klebsiella oxytoca]